MKSNRLARRGLLRSWYELVEATHEDRRISSIDIANEPSRFADQVEEPMPKNLMEARSRANCQDVTCSNSFATLLLLNFFPPYPARVEPLCFDIGAHNLIFSTQ